VLLAGPCMDVCKQVVDSIRSGGQVVCTDAVMINISDSLVSTLSLVYMGRCTFEENSAAYELFSILPQPLTNRQIEFLPLKLYKNITPCAFDCPDGSDNTVLAFCSISQLKQIEHHLVTTEARQTSCIGRRDSLDLNFNFILAEESMKVMLQQFVEIVEKTLSKSNGYMAEAKPGFFLLAFHNTLDAVKWATEVQVNMMHQSWSEEILQIPICRAKTFKDFGVEKLLFRGPRLKIGMHAGNLQAVSLDGTTGRAQFFGPGINVAARVAALAHGGQALIACDGESQMNEMAIMIDGGLEGVSYNDRGPIRMKGVAGLKRVLQVHRNQLGSRKFKPIPRGSILAVNDESRTRGEPSFAHSIGVQLSGEFMDIPSYKGGTHSSRGRRKTSDGLYLRTHNSLVRESDENRRASAAALFESVLHPVRATIASDSNLNKRFFSN